jgi:phosphoribosylformimino-5-aminoimidazole carboxamide ribotide isomerase
MRLIPVIDLLDGQTVHAVRGERAHYRPVKSVLCDTPDPLAIARAFRDQLGLREIYIADLNAIQGFARNDHRDVIAAMARTEELDIFLDAGISDVENAQAWLDHGVRKVVIGSETLRKWDEVQNIPAGIKQDHLIFSLDFQSGKILSQCPALAAMDPIEVLKHLQQSGWQEVILLDLRRVGSFRGADYALAAEAQAKFPDLHLLIGGGIAKPEELAKLKSAGIEGVLVATALHEGIIDAECISSIDAK